MTTNTATIPNGSTAQQIRDLINAGQATPEAAITYLNSRPKLRKPSAELLAELTGQDVQPTKRKPRDATGRNPKPEPEHAAGPVNHVDPNSLENSTLYSAKTGRKLSGFAKQKAWENAVAELNAKPEPSTKAGHKATGGAKRTRVQVLGEMGAAIARLASEYQALCDEQG